MSNDLIVHNMQEQVFSVGEGSDQARLEYHRQGGVVDFSRTFVPTALRGRGIAERLVRHGLAWARAEQLTITASCWYVQKFL